MRGYYIQTFLSLCLLFATVGALAWITYLFALAAMVLFPYALAVVLVSLAVVAIIAWRRSRGH